MHFVHYWLIFQVTEAFETVLYQTPHSGMLELTACLDSGTISYPVQAFTSHWNERGFFWCIYQPVIMAKTIFQTTYKFIPLNVKQPYWWQLLPLPLCSATSSLNLTGKYVNLRTWWFRTPEHKLYFKHLFFHYHHLNCSSPPWPMCSVILSCSPLQAIYLIALFRKNPIATRAPNTLLQYAF